MFDNVTGCSVGIPLHLVILDTHDAGEYTIKTVVAIDGAKDALIGTIICETLLQHTALPKSAVSCQSFARLAHDSHRLESCGWRSFGPNGMKSSQLEHVR